MPKKHPVLTTLAKGAAFALGYWGMKLAIVSLNDWIKNPNREPIIKIDIRTRKKDEYSDTEE